MAMVIATDGLPDAQNASTNPRFGVVMLLE